MKNWESALATALEGRWRRYRAALKRCQRAFSESSIHASRIEARRLGAQFELLRVFTVRRALEKAQRVLKRHLDTFDSLRDAHVQLVILKRECPTMSCAKMLRKITEKRERRCRRKARRHIRKIRIGRLRSLSKMLIERLKEGARNPERMRLDRRSIIRSVDDAFTLVVECRQQMDANDVTTIHRTRIAFKRFRYMMESMRLLFPEIRLHQLEAMRSFQGVLGDLQDTDVFLGRVDKLISRERIDAAEVAIFRRWLLRRRERQVRRCLRGADVVFKFWPLKSVK